MKSASAICLFLVMTHQSLAQNIVMEVNYQDVAPYVTTGQTGDFSITLRNNTSAPVNLILNKSFNFYTDGNTSPDVRMYDPNAYDPANLCQWFTSAYSPWPPWTDGITQSISIMGLPSMTSVSCVGAYHVGMTQGRHSVIWYLSQSTPQGSMYLDQHTQLFVLGPLPAATPVPLLSPWSLVLMFLTLLLMTYCFRNKTQGFSQ